MTKPIQQILPLYPLTPTETAAETEDLGRETDNAGSEVTTPPGPVDEGVKQGRIIYRNSFVHPVTKRRVYSTNGRPFPIRIKGSHQQE